MRSGAALPAVLFGIAMTSALAVGGAYVARQQAANARLWMRAAQVQPAAEEALVLAVAGWDSVARLGQPIGVAEPVTTVPPTVGVRLWITRATTELYWVTAEAAMGPAPEVRRRVGVLVTVRSGSPAPVPNRAWTDLP